jgi:hypothetical protein
MSLGFLVAANGISLRAFLALDYVKFDVIALFERFVAIELDRRVMNKDIRAIVASDKSIALRIVKPLDLSFVLSHRPLFLCVLRRNPANEQSHAPLTDMTTRGAQRLRQNLKFYFIKRYEIA